MHEDVAERIAAGAPETRREAFLRNAVPGLGGALDAVRANPARIKRYNVRQARRIVSLLDDPELLAAVSEHERRTSVRETLRANRAWRRGPHERNCVSCREMPMLAFDDVDRLAVLLSDRRAREDAFGTANLCDEQIIRTVNAVDEDRRPELWKTAFAHTLRHSARAHVEAAAGRITHTPPAGDWGGHSPSVLRGLLDAETTATPALLELALTARHIPDHWEVTDEQWRHLLSEEPEHSVASTTRIPVRVILDTWERLPPPARLQALEHARSEEELAAILPLLETSDIDWSRASERNGERLVRTLHRFPALDENRQLGILSMLPRRTIGEHLLGRLGISLHPGDVSDVLALYSLGQKTRSYRALIDQAGRAETSLENRATRNALIDAIVRVAPPRELFAAGNRVSEAAHNYTWGRLSGDNAVAFFASLLEEWGGTLPELVEAANELSL